MNPSSKILFHFFFILLFTLITSKGSSFSRPTISYSDHCNSYVPEAIPTHRITTRNPLLEPIATHYTGGQNILDQDPTSQRSVFFESMRNILATNVVDTYKIEARLSFDSSSIYYRGSDSSPVGWRYQRSLMFILDGFWSVSTNKLCMVGSARWFTKEGNPLKLHAVLKLKFPGFITLNNSLISGVLESLDSQDDADYFDPISILGFPSAATFSYNYTLVSNDDSNVSKTKSKQDAVTSMRSLDMCSLFTQRFTTYKLVYPSRCKNCSLFGQGNDDYLPAFMSLYTIECSREEKKLRLLVEFQDRRLTPYDQSFRPQVSLIGEGTWNGTKDELCIVACHILNQSDPLGSAHVGDCSFRLTLRFPAVRSITKTHTTEGQIWSTKFTNYLGLFRMAKIQSFDHSTKNYGSKYEYTQMEKVSRVCPVKKRAGAKYEFGYYGFDMFVKYKKMVMSGSVVPMFAGSWGFNSYRMVHSYSGPWKKVMPPVGDLSKTTYTGPLNISFEISFMLNNNSILGSGISSLNLSLTDKNSVKISAEGVYDDETGQICMVGCRNLIKKATFDCEILVKFQIRHGNGGLIKGNIESLRKKSDVLYFEKLDIVSLGITQAEAISTIWIMDIKIVMRLISNALMCVFTGLQLFHLKKRPELVAFISVLMILILTIGHMVPLVIDFEAIYTNTRYEQNLPIGRNGLLEVNKVIVRIVTMVALILQIRLLQLTLIAKKNHWIHEIQTLLICLPTYIIGGLAMLLVNWNNNNGAISSQSPLSRKSQRSIWDDLRSYAGLTVDSFLFPQLILNIFQMSKGNALSHSFYVGITFINLLPHVYDLYRDKGYISHQFVGFYNYANPRSNFYSPAWDIIIVCGGFVFAVIVFLQQRFGGPLMFPKRFQEYVEYEIAPVTSNE